MLKPTHEAIPLERFDEVFKNTSTEISSEALNGRVLAYSDDFFASVHNLRKVGPVQSLKGQFGPKGALYDGWESRRHNPDHDWAIIHLGPQASQIIGFDIDTSCFNGNEGPVARVEGIHLAEGEDERKLRADDRRWETLLPQVPLGPDSRHLFAITPTEKAYSHVKLCMIPDGGIARFRVYGTAIPPLTTERIDLAYALNGGRLVATSNQHYGIASNLLLPGRGFDMGDGWETRRSRVKGHCEWAVVKLADAGYIDHVDIDTAYHMGNPPMYAELHAINFDGNIPPRDSPEWTCILSKKATGPHRQHWFPVENAQGKPFTHVRLTIWPDGGLKRLRIYGYRASGSSSLPASHIAKPIPELEALPLTYEAFAPYGRVIQAYSVSTAAPKGIRKGEANQGTACKYHKMAPIEDRYPDGTRTKTAISVVRAGAQIQTGTTIDVRVLEKHDFSSQAFVPMGKADTDGSPALEDGGAYISIVALSDAQGQPDLSTLRSFLVTASQGVSYAPGVWHHPLLTAEQTLDYACIETRAENDRESIQTRFIGPTDAPFARVIVPDYSGKKSAAPREADSLDGVANGHAQANGSARKLLPCQPLTAASFSKFGSVIQAYAGAPPSGVKVDEDTKFHLRKFLDLAPVRSAYPPEAGASTAVSVFRCTQKAGMREGRPWPVKLLERHAYTDQAFIPMGTGAWSGKGEDPLKQGASYIVIVAENGADDRPDPSTLQAFLASPSQGINYAQGVWHHPMLTCGGTIDFACVETQAGPGAHEELDCELLEYEDELAAVDVPYL